MKPTIPGSTDLPVDHESPAQHRTGDADRMAGVRRLAALDVTEWARRLKPGSDVRAELTSWARSRALRRHAKDALLLARLDAPQRHVHPTASGTASTSAALLGEVSIPCRCSDCEAATSPLAYLADLLRYCSESVERSGGVVDFAVLASELHQPFAELPTQCGPVDAPIRQVRIAVEVLRAVVLASTGSRRIAAPRERAHLARVYEGLLRRLGTSSSELRLAAAGSADARAALAARLGIDERTVVRGGVTRTPLQWLALEVGAGTVEDLESALEQLYGYAHTALDPVPRLAAPPAVPLLADWRRAALRTRWLAQDFPAEEAFASAPWIDPDVIGPDDFRAPLASNPSFAVWQRRRQWLDAQLTQFAAIPAPAAGSRIDAWLATMTPTGGVAAYTPAYGVVSALPTWASTAPGAPLDVLFAQATELAALDRARVAAASALLLSRFGLSGADYTRLIELRERERRALDDARQPGVSEGEFRELAGRLAQARKRLLAAVWRAEEDAGSAATVPLATRLDLGSAQFWAAEHEPLEGDWPPLDDAVTPWLDPERQSDADLPDESAGAAARALHAQRRGELGQLRRTLEQARTTGGTLDDAVSAAYATPALTLGGATLRAFMETALADLSSPDPTRRESAERRVVDELALEVDAFRALMTTLAKDRATVPSGRPTRVELDAAFAALTSAHKCRALYPAWRAAERAGFAYWQLRKARLPAERAAAEARPAWRRELANRASRPWIDPDLIGERLLVRAPATVATSRPTATAAERAAELWSLRRSAVDAATAALRAARVAASTAADGGLSAAGVVVGLDVATLTALGTRRDAGRALSRRLAQLELGPDAFDLLDRVRRLRVAGLSVTDADWEDVYAALTETWKRLRYTAWRREEQARALSLSPDAFQLPDDAAPFVAPRFGAPLADRLAWEDRLRARMEVDAGIGRTLEDVVGAVEEETLPTLRDELVLALPALAGVGTSLEARARALGDRLLIDLRNSGCTLTTRVAQGIESVQNLLFALRTGQLRAARPDWQLRASARRDHDAVMQWLGSYATWRAAVFVLLYPENLLAPALRRDASPAFRALLAELRGGSTTPTQALAAHAQFREYFQDVVSLEGIRATTTLTRWYDERRAFPLTAGALPTGTFLVGTTEAARGRRVYWSLRTRTSAGENQQSHWRRLEQFTEDVAEVLGASVYRTPAQRRYLYLVVKTAKDQKNNLWFLRFALDGDGAWDGQATQLLPSGSQSLPERFDALLLRTGEQDVPRVRLTDANDASVRMTLDLDRLGQSGAVATQSVGRPDAWSDPAELGKVPGSSFSLPSSASVATLLPAVQRPTLKEVEPGGIALVTAANGAVHAIVTCMLAVRSDPSGVAWRVPMYRVLRDLDANGRATSSTGWLAMPSVDVAAHNILEANPVYGSSATWIPNANDPLAGRLVFAAGVQTASTHKLLYWVADRLDLASGAFQTWTVAGQDAAYPWASALGPGLGLAAERTVGGAVNLYVLSASPGQPANASSGAAATLARGILRRSTLGTDGSLGGRWEDVQQFDLENTAGLSTAGLGLAAGRLLGNEQTCLVVGWLVDAPGENTAHLKAWTGAGWTPTETVMQAPRGPNPGWFGGDGRGLGLGLADVDLDRRLDVLVYHVDQPTAGFNGFVRVGRAIGLPEPLGAGDALPTSVTPNYPPLSPAPGLEPRPPAELRAIATANDGHPASGRDLLAEMLYFAPVAIATALQRAGQFMAALDWWRSVYDYSRDDGADRLYPGLERGASRGLWRGAGWEWLQDPLNPHAIAAGRTDTYRRYTLLAVVRCLLDYADAEFTRDTPESLPLARTLYLTAQRLLDDPTLRQTYNGCDALIDTLTYKYGDKPWVGPLLHGYGLGDRVTVAHAATLVEKIDAVLGGDANEPTQYQAVSALLSEAGAGPTPTLGGAFRQIDAAEVHALDVLVNDDRFRDGTLDLMRRVGAGVDAALAGSFGRDVLDKRRSWKIGDDGVAPDGVDAVLPFGLGTDPEPPVAPATDGVIVRPHWGFGGVSVDDLRAFGERHFGRLPYIEPDIHPDIGPHTRVPPVEIEPVEPAPPILSILTCVPPNPVLRGLRLRAELSLRKLRTCRNVAGLRRHVDAYAAATDTRTGLPVIGADGQLTLPGLVAPPPTPYRFRTLLERTRNLVQLAQQCEAALLSALQQGDAERYGLLRARQDVRTTQATVQLQTLRVNEARNGQQLASLQQQRAQVVQAHYDGLLERGMLETEAVALALDATVASIQAASAIGLAYQGKPGEAMQATAGALGTTAGILRQLASQERQRQEWQFQQALAREDSGIAAQQVLLADDQLRIAGQEQAIAELALTHDEAVVEFLGRKFTSVDLYDWMSGVLQSAYRYFLQQATATARLAAAQLAFERQDAVPPFVQADYWRAGDEGDATAPDRRGLTGSIRLLADVTRLEQFAFETDRPRLRLTRTLSIAQLAPLELQRFRERGVLSFATPMELFDRESPGQYLRLVRRVRVAVVALTPGDLGIRATLTASRTSRVVVGGDTFQTVRVQRGPDVIALSAAREPAATSDLTPSGEMLGPFEGIGVDTTWELRMPKAANPFDYASIADVLFTLDYDALYSYDYEQQVLQSLRPTESALRTWSLRTELADQWYALVNPDVCAQPCVARWTSGARDFPPNLDGLLIASVAVYVVRHRGERFEVDGLALEFRESGTGPAVGGVAATLDGLVTTSAGNGAPWSALLGRSPAGQWTLRFPDTESMRARFASGGIDDVLVVVGYSGRRAAWPA